MTADNEVILRLAKEDNELTMEELDTSPADNGIEMKSLLNGSDMRAADDDDDDKKNTAFPKERQLGKATQAQVAVNIVISFVGAGLLGMPYAFSRSGWLLGSISISLVSIANVYAMLLLVKCRQHLESQGHEDILGYGDLGRVVAGIAGERLVNICLVISQVGFATAYIIFIAANFSSIWEKYYNAEIDITPYVCFGCVPILSILVQAKEMQTLSPFSLLADFSNLFGLSVVLFQDYEEYIFHHEKIKAVDFSNLLYVCAIAIYSLEGVGLILPLETSCENRKAFPSLLKKVIFGITTFMVLFGCCGYIAFGTNTQAPITLNLVVGSWANVVKLALCLALYLTYPVMMFPVNQVMESMVFSSAAESRPLFRLGVVIITAFIAYGIPDFGKFLGLVGSSICTLLGFIIPCYFHLQVFAGKLQRWERVLDIFLIISGVIFGVLGTYNSSRELFTED